MYKWNLSQHREPNGIIELELSLLIKDNMIECYCYDHESWIQKFKELLPTIKRRNNFSADLMFKAFSIKGKIEVWKLTADGEKKKKMFTLEISEV